MDIGSRVVVNGNLFQGYGVVEWFATQNDGSRHWRLYGGTPQACVRVEDGRLIHYHGGDFNAGKVREIPADVAPAPAAQDAPIPVASSRADEMASFLAQSISAALEIADEDSGMLELHITFSARVKK